MKRKTILELQPEQRPDEKCMAYGPESLTDAELLAIILRTGTKDETSIDLAERILSPVPDERTGLSPEKAKPEEQGKSILRLIDTELEDLMKIRGIGKVKALKIKAVAELSKRIAMTKAEQGLDFSEPESIAAYYMEQLRHCKKEQVVLILLNSSCQKIKDKVMTVGTATSAMISTREILQEALKYDAVNLILLHNHPSGDPTPSKSDLQSTKRVKKACELMQIPLLDHIIVGDRTYYSMLEEKDL